MTARGSRDVMIYVQHLLGVGHLSRAATIARACDDAGLSTVLVTGGMPQPDLELGGAELLQLPPLRSNGTDFSVLVDAEGNEIDNAFKVDRRDRLLAAFAELRPRVLLIELYPFGRRILRFELEPLIEAARAADPRPWLLCSLRDILNPPRTLEKARWAVERLRADFDRVLVHGDPAIATLEASFPLADEITDLIDYTGYVVESPPVDAATEGAGAGEVVVSTGGGAVGSALVTAALAARAHSALAKAPWRVLVGGNLEEVQFAALRTAAPAGIVVERARPDFRTILARACLSVSQCGYNTALEVVQAGLPAVMVPFETARQREQGLRAKLLQARGLVSVLPAEHLSPESLAATIDDALTRPPKPASLMVQGVTKSVEIIAMLSTKVAPPP